MFVFNLNDHDIFIIIKIKKLENFSYLNLKLYVLLKRLRLKQTLASTIARLSLKRMRHSALSVHSLWTTGFTIESSVDHSIFFRFSFLAIVIYHNIIIFGRNYMHPAFFIYLNNRIKIFLIFLITNV